MRDVLQFGLILPAALLVLSGCATKGWVQERLGQQKTEVDQRIGTVETKVGQVDTKVTEDGQRIGSVEARVTEQGQTMGTRMGTIETSVGDTRNLATGAGARADGAMARANEVDGRLTRLWNNRDARNLVETVEVRFGFGKADLGDGAQTALVGLAREMKENPRLAVELEGYTDSTGSLDYNLALSQRRVETVRRFLVQQGVDLRRILAAGLGPITDRALPAEQKRRVTVKLTTPVE
jgi:outer membrane protein OmpA-like peptidoglycan-associated protein